VKPKPLEVTWEELVAAIKQQRRELLRVDGLVVSSSSGPVSARAQLMVEALCRRAFDDVKRYYCVADPAVADHLGEAWSAYCVWGDNRVFVGPTACAAAHAYAAGIRFGDGILSPEAPLGASPSSEARGSQSKGTEDTTR